MFHKVLVGVDEHPGGRDAVALASKLATRGTSVSLAHIFRSSGDPAVRGYAHDARDIERSRELLEAAASAAGGDPQLRWRGAESPGRGLHELAETLNADLLVLGSTHRGLLGRVLMRDDTRAALSGAPCAVAIAPAGYAGRDRDTAIRRIGVGYDGSPESERALIAARLLAAEHGADLAALEVVFFPTYLFAGPVAGDETTIDDLISDALQRVSSLEDVEPHAAYGQPAEELGLWSASLDLLVIGSRGFGPVGRLMHGSTSQELTRRARCPLLVLARGQAKPWQAGDGVAPDEIFAAPTR